MGDYSGAASNRDQKIIRAIESVVCQSFEDWELIVVADGCDKTFDIVCEKYSGNKKIECLLIKKQPIWGGHCRNLGIEKAKGDYISYLDIDDYYGKEHLKKINDQLAGEDWLYFNDRVLNRDGLEIERNTLVNQRFQCGTSNIIHKKSLVIKWGGGQYGHDDWSLIQQLNKFPGKKIDTPDYIVCHSAHRFDY